ncbi:MAG: hypothetical protein PHC61_04715 [Chitinivibrionales bacterium]|nr:hypothetical protein [Chitinivibrionales bacterium]
MRSAVCFVACLGLNAVSSLAATAVSFSPATLISSDNDISTVGTLVYAYNWNGTDATVNGVTFKGTRNTTTVGSDLSFPSPGPGCDFPPDFCAGGTTLSAAYQHLLGGAAYEDYEGDWWRLQLKGLVVGHSYHVQMWSMLSYYDQASTRISDSSGNSVTLKKDNTNDYGGRGQFTIGTFTANATTLTLTLTGIGPFIPDKGALLNAMQLRDITNVGVVAKSKNVTAVNNFGKGMIYDIQGRRIGVSVNGGLPHNGPAGILLLKSGASAEKVVTQGAIR